MFSWTQLRTRSLPGITRQEVCRKGYTVFSWTGISRLSLMATMLDYVCLPGRGATWASFIGPMGTSSDSEDSLPLHVLPPRNSASSLVTWFARMPWIGHKSRPSLLGGSCSSLRAVWSLLFLLLLCDRVLSYQERPRRMTRLSDCPP